MLRHAAGVLWSHAGKQLHAQNLTGCGWDWVKCYRGRATRPFSVAWVCLLHIQCSTAFSWFCGMYGIVKHKSAPLYDKLFRALCHDLDHVVLRPQKWGRLLGMGLCHIIHVWDIYSMSGDSSVVEWWTPDQNVMGSIPGRSGRRIVLSKVSFLCRLISVSIPPLCYCSSM